MRSLSSIGLVTLTLAIAACAPEDGAFLDHDEDSDFDDVPAPADGKADVAGIPAVFDRHDVISDALFEQSTALDVANLQAFFERSPYNNRSWLADYTTPSGISAAQAIVDAALAENVNPLVLVARMQVEKSLVSKTVRPSQRNVDYAFGCGCPDGSGCSSTYRGFDKQVACAARVLRKWYDGSVAGDGLWVKGRAKRTLDPLSVTPKNHATATMYAYTPWVLVGRGGNWLVWNVQRKYFRHADDNDLLIME
jgi:hypothetical protein